jgi:hypothetical protein
VAAAKSEAPADVTAGTRAYHLAMAHDGVLTPRLPTGLLAALAADLGLLGADPRATETPDAPAPPSLADALTAATTLITAIHAAVLGASPKPEVRKAYGAKAKGGSLEAKDVLAVGDKILSRAQTNPTEALSLGILPADLEELTLALAAVRTAEAAARAVQAGAPSAKERRAAEARVKEAVARIAGAGALAFAKDSARRAEFAALVG